MADNVLVEKVFNLICGSGGFVELSLLLRDSSPLKDIKSNLDAKNWLINHGRGRFVVLKDIDDEVRGVRIDLKKKICQQYLERGSCRRAGGSCKFWHICKRYIEGNCEGNCRRSHNFFDKDNEAKTKDLKIEKHPNGTLRNVIAWSLPQVCQLYLRNECKADKCPYLHICPNVVRKLPCGCGLSHNLTEVNNKKILKQYDLVPHQSMSTAFVCSSILIMKEQSYFDQGKFISDDTTVEMASVTPAEKSTKFVTQNNTNENSLQHGASHKSNLGGTKDYRAGSKSREVSNDNMNTKKNEPKPDQSKSKEERKQKGIPKYGNNLASCATASASTKKHPGFLNIHEEEESLSDSSSEDNKPDSKSFLSANERRSIHQIPESKLNSKVAGNDCKFLQPKAASQMKSKADLRISNGAAKASAVRNDPFVLPVDDIGNDLVKKWVLGDDYCSSDSTHSLRDSQNEGTPAERKRKLSISSSCSSVPDPQKNTPSKKAVFDCILKEYNGTVPFLVISKRKELFPEGCGDIAAWFKSRKESFLFRESVDGAVKVDVHCQRAKLCFNQDHCSKEECPYIHVCRDYIAGFCRFGRRCQRNHSFEYDKSRKFISKLKLTGFSEEQLRKVVQLSIPQVCLDYNEGHCVLGESCGKIHICKDMIRKKCVDQAICGLEHEKALLTAQATAVLNRYGLKVRNGNTHPVVRALLVCERKYSGDLNPPVKDTISTTTSMSSSITAVDSKGEKEQSGSNPFSFTSVSVAKTASTVSTTISSTMTKGAAGSKNISYQQSGPSPLSGIASCDPSDHIVNVIESIRKEIFPSGNSSEPSERKVFECLCKEYNCSVSFSVISKRTDLFPTGFKDVEAWFRKKNGSFLILENSEGKITEVSAFATKARLCFSYNNAHKGTCTKDNCSFLHICRDYITDSCANGATCPRNHQFRNEKDKALLSQINLGKFTDEQLRRLVLSSSPLICVEYNDGICDRGDACPRIHMCSDHLKTCSREGRGCLLEHESATTTDHTRAILERFRMDYLKPGTVKKAILLFDDLAQSRETGHVHNDKPDATICSDFLLGKCKKGMKCSGHHCSLPYHWQYRVEDEGVWKSFTETDNEKVEKLYCDAMMDDCSATGIQLSFESDGFLLFDEEYAVNFLFENKMMFVQKDFEVLADIRRLCTEPSIDNLGNPLASAWTWYWKDENGMWLAYGSDYLGNDLQRQIEDTFSPTSTYFEFKIAEQDYALYFHEMQQKNLRYGTTRQVRRRPGEFRSSADIREIRRSSRKGKTSANVSSTGRPSNWASMPPSMQYTRVALRTVTSEYKEVERLFKSSIQKRVVILRIERVQNSFMWGKYQRKKENMLAIKGGSHSLNEKRLFHGTSPDAVEAICKQNFDWRLNGKNATVYGEGSYFAVNASYSDAYAKKNANSSQFMFLAKVLVGSYTKGDSSYRRPPPKQPFNPSSDLFDSCVNDQYSPTIYVVFDTDQFYPEYIIEYSDESSRYSGARGAPSSAQTGASPSRSSVNPTSSYYLSSGGASSGFGSASNSSFGTPYRSTATGYSSGTASSQNTAYSSHISSTGTSRNYSSSTNTPGVPYHRSTPSSSSTPKSSKDNKCLVM